MDIQLTESIIESKYWLVAAYKAPPAAGTHFSSIVLYEIQYMVRCAVYWLITTTPFTPVQSTVFFVGLYSIDYFDNLNSNNSNKYVTVSGTENGSAPFFYFPNEEVIRALRTAKKNNDGVVT